MKAVVFTLGCKVNQYEGQAIAAKLKEYGAAVSTTLEPADLYIINTCSVTAEADRKSRQAVARVLKLNPGAKVVVLGCSSQNDFKAYLKKDNVIFISGTAGKIEAIDHVMSDIVCKKHHAMSDIVCKKHHVMSDITCKELPKTYEDNLYPELTKTRGIIKIQDGCDRFCAYCRIPYLRGRSRSRPLESIIMEASRLIELSGEIVLTGIDISSYGKDTGTDLTTAVKELGALKNSNGVVVRKRLGSLECGIITKELLIAMRDGGFCDHFHLSLQSGCDTVLKRMNRHYTVNQYLEKVNLIRRFFPFAGITTDIIAGFPGETDAEHEQTVDFIKRVSFSDIHVFPYSRRIGTNAYSFDNQMDDKIKTERAKELTATKQEIKSEFLCRNLGRTVEVYAEERDGSNELIREKEKNCAIGFTSNYIKVYTESEPGQMVTRLLKKTYKDGVWGD